MKSDRIVNLDLYRFTAISLVIYLHIGESFPFTTNSNFILLGKYGVDLFFVLSGFLITNIYYKRSHGKSLVRFWLQRFLRTYPPYLVALLISYLAVFVDRKQSFDLNYLIFLQNYYYRIPYFKVSWSLCIEEHFYLAFPFIILITERLIKNRTFNLIIWLLIVISPSFIRYFWGDFRFKDFGYYTTATFFRFDGIAIGCTISFIINRYKIALKSNWYISFILFLVFIVASYWMDNIRSQFQYAFGYFLLVLVAGLWLVSSYFSKGFIISKYRLVKIIAGMAYSLYLTHTLVIHICDVMADKFHWKKILIIPVCLLLVFFAGRLYYFFIEKPSIKYRDKIL